MPFITFVNPIIHKHKFRQKLNFINIEIKEKNHVKGLTFGALQATTRTLEGIKLPHPFKGDMYPPLQYPKLGSARPRSAPAWADWRLGRRPIDGRERRRVRGW